MTRDQERDHAHGLMRFIAELYRLGLLKHNRIELQQEWKSLKAGPERPMAVKQGPRAKKRVNMGVKTPKRPVDSKKPAVSVAAKESATRSSENAADDAWHARNKDTSGQAQTNRLNAVTDRLTRRAAISPPPLTGGGSLIPNPYYSRVTVQQLPRLAPLPHIPRFLTY